MSASREKSKRKAEAANPVPAAKQKKGMSKSLKTALGIVCAVLVIAVVVFFTMLTTGFFEQHTTAAVVNGHSITPATLNYYYQTAYQTLSNQMGDFLSYMIDSETPLDEQYYDEEAGTTWADVLTEQALTSASSTYAVYDEALANGFTLTDEDEANIDSTVSMYDYYATAYGYGSADAFLAAQYGTGCNTKNYRDYLEVNTLAGNYAQHVNDSFTYSADDLKAEYEADPSQYDTVNYRLFTITSSMFEETDDEDALKQQQEQMASEMAAAAQNNEAAFIASALKNASESAKESYQDESYTLRTGNGYASCPESLADWLYDTARQEGDTTYVENSSGYYVAYFISRDNNDYGMPNVRHILISVSDTTDEEAMAEAQAKAEDILTQFEAGEQTEDAFAALAQENSADNAEAGGLYENIYPGQMVDAFNDWCYDPARQVGDTGIVQTNYGYHVMYFCGRGDNLRDYLVESALREADYTAWNDAVTADAAYTTNSLGMHFTTK